MGYYTRFTLTFDQNTPDGQLAAAFLEHGEIKDKPFSAIRKKYPDVVKYMEDMEVLWTKFSSLGLVVIEEERSSFDASDCFDTISGAWRDNGGEIKWYSHVSDMRVFSKLFPKVLFTLRGEGEESGDIWAKYFLDGKMQEAKAEVVIAPFDASKLK